MNDHLKHIVCFRSSDISMYLTEIYSAVNVYIIVNQWDATFNSFRHEST